MKLNAIKTNCFVILQVIKLLLEPEGYKVLTATDGLSGIEIAKKEMPNIILLDINMPKISGLLVADIVSKDEALSHIPIILLTGMPNVSEKATDIPGVIQQINKPFDYKELISSIGKILEKSAQKI